MPAVVRLIALGPAGPRENRECAATGFLINDEGYLITAAHFVTDAQRCLRNAPGAKILASLAAGDSHTAEAVPCDVIGIDAANDVALLRTGRPLVLIHRDKSMFAMLDASAVRIGETVAVSGYPAFSWEPVTQAGHVLWVGKTALEEIDYPLPDPSDAVGIDIHLQPGNSGSPVYRPNGGVIAIVDKRDPRRPSYSVAVAIRYAIELAQRYGVTWQKIEPSRVTSSRFEELYRSRPAQLPESRFPAFRQPAASAISFCLPTH